MDDFLQNLRIHNIFGNSQPLGMPDLSKGNINPDMISSMLNRVGDFYANNHPQSYQTFGSPNQMPQGNGLNRIAQAASGGNYIPGSTTTKPMDVVWGSDSYKSGNISPLQRETLDLKRQDLDQKRELGQQRLDITDKNNQNKTGIARTRAEIYEFKAKHPDVKIQAPKGGNLTYYDPTQGKMVDTGIPSGTMTEEDKQHLIGQQKQEEIGSRGAESANVATIRNTGELANIAARGAQARQTKEDVPNKAELPTQTRVRITNNANKLLNTNPELAQFIKIDPNGMVNVTGPSEGWTGHSGPTAEQYKKINDAIYGAAPSSTVTTPSSTTPKKGDKKKFPNGVEGEYDGTGWVPVVKK